MQTQAFAITLALSGFAAAANIEPTQDSAELILAEVNAATEAFAQTLAEATAEAECPYYNNCCGCCSCSCSCSSSTSSSDTEPPQEECPVCSAEGREIMSTWCVCLDVPFDINRVMTVMDQ